MADRQPTPNILDDLMSAAPAGVTKPAATSLRLAEIRRDGGTQPRAGLDEAHVQDLIAALANGDELPPVDVVFDGSAYWLYDGFHRVEAHGRSGKYLIAAIIHQGTQADAQWQSYGVNRGHGLKRTNEDKKRAVLAALKHPNAATLSNVQIAKHCGVDESTIRVYRAQMEATSGFPKSDTRTGADGRVYQTVNIGKSRPQPKRDDAAEDAWRPPGIGARTMQQETTTPTSFAVEGAQRAELEISIARQVVTGRPLVEVIKTDAEIAAEVEAADIASREAAADEAARQAQAAAATDVAFGMAPPRHAELVRILDAAMEALPEIGDMITQRQYCLSVVTTLGIMKKELLAAIAKTSAPTAELPAELVAAGWELHTMRGKHYAAVSVPTEEEPIRTQLRADIADTIRDAQYMHKSLRIGA